MGERRRGDGGEGDELGGGSFLITTFASLVMMAGGLRGGGAGGRGRGSNVPESTPCKRSSSRLRSESPQAGPFLFPGRWLGFVVVVGDERVVGDPSTGEFRIWHGSVEVVPVMKTFALHGCGRHLDFFGGDSEQCCEAFHPRTYTSPDGRKETVDSERFPQGDDAARVWCMYPCIFVVSFALVRNSHTLTRMRLRGWTCPGALVPAAPRLGRSVHWSR